MDEKKSVELVKRSCKKCGSKFVYVRIKDPKSLVCRSCGNIEKLEDQE